MQDGAIAGIFSERDVVYGLAQNGPAMLDGPVGAVMTAPVISVDPQSDVLDALGLMTGAGSATCRWCKVGQWWALSRSGTL